MQSFICCRCNQPVSQPHCRIEVPKLKPGVLPFGCPFGIASPVWKRARNTKVDLQNGTQQTNGAEPQAEITPSFGKGTRLCDSCGQVEINCTCN
jgi:hypothetical protein